jgi:flagellar motility protein MotE (MotC chaperone)
MSHPDRNPRTMSVRELLQNNIVCERYEELTHLDCIVLEEELIDHHRIDVLKKSMQGRRGQIDPVTLRARLADEQVIYDIINGYHRTPAIMAINQENEVQRPLKTTVLYGCSDEEMYDLRVIAADNVKSIKFPRMAKWMTLSFQSRKWDNPRIAILIHEGNLTLSQVFSQAAQDGSGKILKLTEEENGELKTWALNKADLWGKPISSLVADMRLVDEAAPDLVQRVRLGGGGKGERGVLTQARLNAIASNLQGEWELQRIFVDMAIQRNILAEDLDFLAFAYANAMKAGDKPAMERILKNPDALLHPPWPEQHPDQTENSEPVFHGSKWRQLLQKSKANIPVKGQDHLIYDYENHRAAGQFVTTQVTSGDTTPQRNKRRTSSELRHENRTIAALLLRIDEHINVEIALQSDNQKLSHDLAEARATILRLEDRLKGDNTSVEKWWNVIPDLPERERKLLEFIFVHNMDLEEAAKEMSLLDNQLINLLISSVRRLSLFKEGIRRPVDL